MFSVSEHIYLCSASEAFRSGLVLGQGWHREFLFPAIHGNFTGVCMERSCSLTLALPDGPEPPMAESSPGQWELKVTPKQLGHHMAGIKEGTLKSPSEGARAPGIQKSLFNILPWTAQSLPTSNPTSLRWDVSISQNLLQPRGVYGQNQQGPVSAGAAVKSIFACPKGGSSKPELETHSRKKFQ